MLLIQMHRDGRSLFSRLIRWFSRSEYHHVSVWHWNAHDPEGGTVIEAVEGHGVRWQPATAYRAKREAGTIRLYAFREPLTGMETQVFWAALVAELGRGYDWRGVLRFVSRRRKDGHPEKWFCSELVAAAAAAAGRPLFSSKPAWQVMPSDIPQSLALVPCDDPTSVLEEAT